MSRTYGALVALAAAVPLAGCGGSSSHHRTRSTVASTSRQSYTAPATLQVAQRRPAHPARGKQHHSRTTVHAATPRSQPSGHRQHRSSPHTTTTQKPAAAPSVSFKQSYLSIVGQMTTSARAVGSALRDGSQHTHRQNLRIFRSLATRWQSQLSRLKLLTPPSKLASAFNDLTRLGARIGRDLGAIATAIAGRNLAAGGKAAARIVADIAAAQRQDGVIRHALGVG